MADAPSDVREMEARLTGKVTKFVLEVGCRRIIRRDDMIEQDKETFRAKDFTTAKGLPGLEGKDAGPIVHVGLVNPPVNVFAGWSSEYLFGKGSHVTAPSWHAG
jgi:hypothetical protein